MLLSLDLTNWKSHARSSFSFCKGTNILVGRMGAGKSSVLDALCFALYGTFPKLSRRDQGVESLVNINSDAQYAEVKLAFDKGGKKYEVERRIGKKLSEAELRVDGKLAQKGAKQVTETITQELGVDYELFTRAIYSEQNRIDQLLSLTPKARKGEIDWLLGLGQFDEARDAMQTAALRLSEKASELAREADLQKLSEAEKRLAAGEAQEKDAIASCSSLEERVAGISKSHKEKSSELAALESLRLEHRKKKSECDVLSGTSARLAREVEGKTRVSFAELAKLGEGRKMAEGELARAKEEMKKSQAALSSATSEAAVLKSGLAVERERIKKKKQLDSDVAHLSKGKSVPEIESKIAVLKKEGERISQERAHLIAEQEALSDAAETLSSENAKCPVCDSDLSNGKAGEISQSKRELAQEKEEMAKTLLELLNRNRKETAGLEADLSKIKLFGAESERLAREIGTADGLEAKLASAEGRKAALEGGLKESEGKITSAEEKLETARFFHEEGSRSAKLFSDYDSARQKLTEAQTALSSIKFDEEKHDMVRKEAEALSISLASAKTGLAGEQKRLALVRDMKSMAERELNDAKSKASLAAMYTEASQSSTIYKNSLTSAQSELRLRLIEEINEALIEIWPAIYPYSDYDGVKIEADEKDYRLMMQKDGWKEVDAIASGGERACLCLALRVAFATVLTPDLSWLILDEPTHNLDAEAISLLSAAIGEKIPQIVEQTFVITHEPSLGETEHGRVITLERDKSKGESTKVIAQEV